MKTFQLKYCGFILLIGLKSTAQFSTTIPLSKDVVSGKLKNGMKYYVLHNAFPKDRVSFYFAQNVGVIPETLNKITLSDIKAFAKQFFAQHKTVEVVMKSKP